MGKKLHLGSAKFGSPVLATRNFPTAEQKWRELQEKEKEHFCLLESENFLGLGQKLIDVSRKSVINITGFGFWGI